MAILWMDGCDTYSSTSDVLLRYAGSNAAGLGLATTGGRFGGGAIYPGNNTNNAYLGPVNFTHSGSSAIIAGGAVNFASTNSYYLQFCNTTSNAASYVELRIDYSGGVLQLWRGNGTTLLATSTVSVSAGIWHHLEMKATCADSGGSAEIRLNGVQIISFSGDTRQSTTGTAGFDRIYFCGYGTGAGAWDDLYVLDTTGSVANNFLGDARINTLTPSSDSAVQFTRSTGTSNWSCVDEGRVNSDTDYVESSTAGQIDKFGYTDLPASVATVHGLQVLTWARKTDASNRTMRNKLYSGATTSDGSTFGLSTSYTAYAQIATVDPNTSGQWSVANANAALAGYEIIS